MSKLFSIAVGGVTTASIASYFWSSSGQTQTQLPQQQQPIVTTGSNSSSSVTSSSPVNPQEFFKYGFPGPIHDLQTHQEFITCYDRSKRNPYYVIEHITPQSIKSPNGGGVDRKKSIFKEDETIPLKFRALLKDYFRSGYDRGHQAPAADAKFNQLAMDETFALTNISPQVGDGFNRDYWAHLEQFCRDLTKTYNNVRIVTGPLYLPKRDPIDGKWKVSYEVIGNPPNIAVPTHFFKLIVCEDYNDVKIASFVLPNSTIDNSTPLKSFQVPLDALERSSGLNFLQNLDNNKKKNLCDNIKCEITVREFQKLALPSPK
ncbi:hypothetical protein WICMUC_000575 [Wickerhamomyces mucosus]|uniref:Endonuclease n=1 Tax=Wickerhamomyces mucosus TaxID=1378264 RepID=A0A9P8PZA5_9ASCO|nr:hypothetical protein WICMUC_000575 [Wickerhamomyces mucosus]